MLKLSSLHISFYRILLFSLTTVNSIHPLIIYHQVHFSLFLYSTIFSHNYCTNILQLYILNSYLFSYPHPCPPFSFHFGRLSIFLYSAMSFLSYILSCPVQFSYFVLPVQFRYFDPFHPVLSIACHVICSFKILSHSSIICPTRVPVYPVHLSSNWIS